jgi:diaminohydroxyphosphoribosylaminopyrimidine deaminase/5-amino-6-(5-phosphoribosylamino)uracil reductase
LNRHSDVKVYLIGISTIDGRISPAGFGSPEDRQLLEHMRDITGAGLIGANTLRAENPEMRGSTGILPADRIRSIISGSGSIPTRDKKIFACGPPPLIFTSLQMVPSLQRQLGGRAEVIGLEKTAAGLSLPSAIARLAARGVDSLLIEGGANLNYAALRSGIVDELVLTISPKVSGDGAATSLAEGPTPLGNPYLDLYLLSCRTGKSGEIYARYKVNKAEDF